ncbi:hydroxymethylglutaryl-CoA lyase [Oceanobacillus bengalensis]|uniref:Hydroxymethylglutaryl-CoA lyase n=1 Tax=Oceanobacillus bengalensis TaxID=1435466 RepID=A0A494YZ89_9BACI|nr:hydroxymethylglutaryl-CoA lyase [Oceanobacillus bengalensis]RKQ15540.1 hydroxymethylglutaryl-CoA lyase [Oceanobacillus bengalensis]
MIYPQEVVVTEVCPRDGFQSLPEFIPTEEKVEIVNELMTCGFKQIEITSFVHPKAIPQLRDSSELLSKIKRNSNVKLRALIPNLKGLERAIDSGVDKVKLMLSATDSHSISNANCKTAEALRGFEPVIYRANEESMKATGSISVAFGCPFEGMVPIERLLSITECYAEMGVNEISLADTAGMANPVLIKNVIESLKKEFTQMKFTLHLHNTRGMAFANAVAGLEAGVTDFDSSVAGIGGCPYVPNGSGNIASEDLIHGFEEMGIQTGVDLDKVIAIGKKINSQYPNFSDSYVLKAGKTSELSLPPAKQQKVGETNNI